ncbi:MAG: hypothetical protein RL591_2455 [Planctomycetota bacterium]
MPRCSFSDHLSAARRTFSHIALVAILLSVLCGPRVASASESTQDAKVRPAQQAKIWKPTARELADLLRVYAPELPVESVGSAAYSCADDAGQRAAAVTGATRGEGTTDEPARNFDREVAKCLLAQFEMESSARSARLDALTQAIERRRIYRLVAANELFVESPVTLVDPAAIVERIIAEHRDSTSTTITNLGQLQLELSARMLLEWRPILARLAAMDARRNGETIANELIGELGDSDAQAEARLRDDVCKLLDRNIELCDALPAQVRQRDTADDAVDFEIAAIHARFCPLVGRDQTGIDTERLLQGARLLTQRVTNAEAIPPKVRSKALQLIEEWRTRSLDDLRLAAATVMPKVRLQLSEGSASEAPLKARAVITEFARHRSQAPDRLDALCRALRTCLGEYADTVVDAADPGGSGTECFLNFHG